MKWKYYKPEFEFDGEIFSAWWGHVFFAYDLVMNMKPKKIVELGTHNGVSFFSFCQAVKDGAIKTELNAVDTWDGDKHASFYGKEIFNGVESMIEKYYPELDIKLRKKTFDKALADFDDKTIDLLHIDGLHTYEAVNHDFNSWASKVKDDGVIMFHDIHERKGDFGVYKLWKELKDQYETIEFYHWHGLGILFMNKSKKNILVKDIDELKGLYNNLADKFLFGKVKSETKKSLNLKNTLNKEIEKKTNEIIEKDKEMETMKASFLWKLRSLYVNFKK